MTLRTQKRSALAPGDLAYVRKRYETRIQEAGVTVASLNAGTLKKQRILHGVHASAFQGPRARVLDVGCGLAQFYGYLVEQGLAPVYTGYDIVPAYVEACKKRYPEALFKLRNIFESGIGDSFDTIVFSQVLNNHYRESDNIQVMQAALEMAFRHTRHSVSVDMLSTHVDYCEPHLYYYDPGKILDFARTLTPHAVLRQDHHPFEFCIQLFRDKAR